MQFISKYLALDKLLQKIASEMLSNGVESCQYKHLNKILNSIEVYEEPVPRTKKLRIEFYTKVCNMTNRYKIATEIFPNNSTERRIHHSPLVKGLIPKLTMLTVRVHCTPLNSALWNFYCSPINILIQGIFRIRSLEGVQNEVFTYFPKKSRKFWSVRGRGWCFPSIQQWKLCQIQDFSQWGANP